MIDILLILFAIFLVFLNAFFVAAEFGMVKLRRTRMEAIRDHYGFRGKILYHIHSHLDSYLTACQFGITLASLGLGWIGEPAVAENLEPVFSFLGIKDPQVVTGVSFLVAFFFISFIHIVVGELMPKSLALRQSEKVSIWTGIPLYVFYWLFYPIIWLLSACSNYLLKAAGLDKIHKRENYFSTEEIKLILATSHLQGELTKIETEILEHTLDLADLKVTELMRHADEMVGLDIHESMNRVMETVMEKKYSRYPILDSAHNEIIGIVHVKDLFAEQFKMGQINDLTKLMRPILKVSRRLSALDLLNKFREKRTHFALVYRNADLLGFVTLDNLLHLLIGRVRDEFHKTQDHWRVNPDGSLTIRGDCPIAQLERALDQDIDLEYAEVETITGLILNKLGRLPTENEWIEFPEFKVFVEKMRRHRMMKLKIIPKPKRIQSEE
jgi:CBS domain containing-hemolysin-like protein